MVGTILAASWDCRRCRVHGLDFLHGLDLCGRCLVGVEIFAEDRFGIALQSSSHDIENVKVFPYDEEDPHPVIVV